MDLWLSFIFSGFWLCQRNAIIFFIDTDFLAIILGIIWTVGPLKRGQLGSCSEAPVTICPLMLRNIAENKSIRCFFFFLYKAMSRTFPSVFFFLVRFRLVVYNIQHFSLKGVDKKKLNIHFWPWIWVLVIFGCRFGLSMTFEAANKKSSNISSLTVHMPAFLKPLWASVVGTDSLYAVETISLLVSLSSAFLEKCWSSHHGMIPLAHNVTTYLRFDVMHGLRW